MNRNERLREAQVISNDINLYSDVGRAIQKSGSGEPLFFVKGWGSKGNRGIHVV